jgi:hypothetical protein
MHFHALADCAIPRELKVDGQGMVYAPAAECCKEYGSMHSPACVVVAIPQPTKTLACNALTLLAHNRNSETSQILDMQDMPGLLTLLLLALELALLLSRGVLVLLVL